MPQSGQAMKPPIMCFAFQMQCSHLDGLYLRHLVELEVCVQLLYPSTCRALGSAIMGGKIYFPNSAVQLIILHTIALPLLILFGVAKISES